MNPPKIAIVIPCYNEQEVLPITMKVLLDVLDRASSRRLLSTGSYLLCVDDGSSDSTWRIIGELHNKDSRVKGISLAHNSGHQNALFAGLMTAKGECDAAISIDADLQDDPEAIFEMLQRYADGKDIVYGQRSARDCDSLFKKSTARAFYRIQREMGIDAIPDHADFRLMSGKALEMLAGYGECNLFLRGIVPQIGLENDIVTYERHKRAAGETKYPLSRMIAFSVDGITSFSAKPIRLIFLLGLVMLIADIAVAIYVALSILWSDSLEAGWASLILSIWFLGSLILMAIGIVGEYIGKIYIEAKHRPRYAIRDKITD